jgi:hypothetical protein
LFVCIDIAYNVFEQLVLARADLRGALILHLRPEAAPGSRL